MVPGVLLLPLVMLATAATVIASQAVITGAFSLTNQATHLGYLPQVTVRRTSETQAGEIYIPQINLVLGVGVVLLIAIFHTSDGLAHAYGLAVTGTMVVTTVLAFIVVTRHWRWPLWVAALLVGPLLAIDVTFLAANSLKLLSGGFVPLVIAAALIFVMVTWSRGCALIRRRAERDTAPLEEMLPHLKSRSIYRASGTAVFLTSDASHVPGALLHNLKHNRVLHQHNIVVSVETTQTPRVAESERATIERLDDDFSRVRLKWGYMESPNVPQALAALRKQGLPVEGMSTSYFIGRRTIVRSPHGHMPFGMDRLYIWLARNAADPTDYFHIPPGRVVEMGAQMTL
jgi:KUP system potassium uptake protein